MKTIELQNDELAQRKQRLMKAICNDAEWKTLNERRACIRKSRCVAGMEEYDGVFLLIEEATRATMHARIVRVADNFKARERIAARK